MNQRVSQDRKIFPARQGFTLVEMMIIIAIVGIIAVIAAPPMFRLVQTNTLQTTSDRMLADLHYARSLSITNGQVLRFTSTLAGYQVIEPISGTVLREADFKGGLTLAAAQTSDFFPWGMANATVFNLSNPSGAKQINLLPTGLAEVN